MSLSFIHGGMLSEYDNEGDFFSDLSKALVGFRLPAYARPIYEHFVRNNPGQIPVVYGELLLTGSQVEAEIERERVEAIEAEKARARKRIEAENTWHAQSPMQEALRNAGLIPA